MAILPVLKYPHAVLKTRAEEVSRITETERRLVRDMIETRMVEEIARRQADVNVNADSVGVAA